jgi:regulator of sigma E protease
VTAGSLAEQVGLQPGDILLKLGDQPTHVSAAPDFHFNVWSKPSKADPSAPQVLTISRQGQIVQMPLKNQTTTQGLLNSLNYLPILDTQILRTAKGSPAEQGGLKSGDVVYQVNDETIGYKSPLNLVIGKNLGKEVTLTVLRDQQWVKLQMTPRKDPPKGEGALGVQIGPMTQLATLPLLSSLWQGVVSTAEYILVVVQLPIMLIVGRLSPSEAQLSGPVGIAEMVGGAVSATIDTGLWFPIWRLSAVLSAALAVTNLLPLPALDGGRLLFILIETLRGRRVNPEREGFVHMIGFMLLLGLLVYITVQDIRTEQVGIDWHTLLGQ